MELRNERRIPGLRAATNRRAFRVLLALSSGVPALGAREALADCALPKPAIVWSYPAQGDTDVPTNVDLWVLPSGWGAPPIVSRDGVTLTPLRTGYGYDAGELAPNTTYTFRVELDTYDEVAPIAELTFTTGAGPVAPDSGASPGAVVPSASRERALSESCKAALSTQDCFDQGQDTYYQFTPSGNAKGWVLMTDSSYRPLNIWPGECGAPTWFGSSFRAPCATLYGIDAAGQLHAGEPVCAEAPAPPAQPSDGPDDPPSTAPAPGPASSTTSRGSATNPAESSTESGCSLAPARSTRATSGALAFVALALAALRRAHRRR